MKFRKPKKNKKGLGAALDLTPVIDVVFNLLIFFAVTLNFASTSGGINIKLPTTGSADPLKAENITINITKEGELYLNDKALTMYELTKRLQAISDKDSIVIIRADDKVNHGRVVTVMDRVKSSGFKRLAIATAQAPKPRPSPPKTAN